MTAVGHQGIGATKTLLWSWSDEKERRAMNQSEAKRGEEHVRQSRALEMGSQGAWTTWNTTDRKLTWRDICKYEPLRLSFIIRSVYDLLTSPANLCRWGLTDDTNCILCDRSGTLEHVLSSCSTSVTQGRYRWRHDTVLSELVGWLAWTWEKEGTWSYLKHHITFVKPGKTTTQQASIFDGATGWNMEVDLFSQTLSRLPWDPILFCAPRQGRSSSSSSYSTMVDKMWRGLWEKESKVHQFCGPLQTARVAYLAVPRWSRR